MIIAVLGKAVETQEILDIVDIEANKTMFMNREAGFIIKLLNKEDLVFSESIPYESYPSDIKEIKAKWSRLRKEIYDKWCSDKLQIQTFDFK